MKVVILAGGYGTRLSEETASIPKPLVEISGKPLIWYIMQHYAFYGFNDFIIAGGYKVEKLKEYFRQIVAHCFNRRTDLADTGREMDLRLQSVQLIA